MITETTIRTGPNAELIHANSQPVYRFAELPDKGKERALADWQTDGDYPWGSDNESVLTTFCELFPVESKEWSYGNRSSITPKMTRLDNDEIWDFTGIRLLKYIENNYMPYICKPKYLGLIKGKSVYSKCQLEICCPLTGYCLDHDIIQPILDFIAKPHNGPTLEDLLNECLWSWVYACQKDFEYYYSEESFADTAEANDWLFYASGKMV